MHNLTTQQLFWLDMADWSLFSAYVIGLTIFLTWGHADKTITATGARIHYLAYLITSNLGLALLICWELGLR